MKEKISVILIEDHKMVREAWTMILDDQGDYKVISANSSAEEGLEEIKKLRPEIVILDINLPGMNGIELVPFIRKYSPGTKVIGVSSHTMPAYVKNMMKKGAMGYLTKNSSQEELFFALAEVYQGRQYVCSQIASIISDELLDKDNKSSAAVNALTKRELEVIRYIAQGDSSRSIAVLLNITPKTVEVHRYNILRKLNVKNTPLLVEFIHTNYPVFFS